MTEGVFLGLDLGCRRAKAVAVDAAGAVLARAERDTGRSFEAAARALGEALAGRLPPGAAVAETVTTGAGRRRAPATATRRTGIACCARAARALYGRELDVVDLGGRGSTLVRVGADGAVRWFLRQRRCAAGTGAFLEEVARRLELAPAELGRLAEGGDPAARLRHACSLFAAEEAQDRVRDGEPLADLCRAALGAVVEQLLGQGPLGPFVVLAGGVAERFSLLAPLLATAAGARVEVPAHPAQLAALGAALLARDRAVGQSSRSR